MVITTPQIKKILKNPEKAAEVANLVYITSKKLTISRYRHGRGFYYIRGEEKVKDKISLRRFKSLVIPPAWEDVQITHLENGHLQVVGKDAKGRKQYRYHPHWSMLRNRTKFFKMLEFGRVLPFIREQVDRDLRSTKMTKKKCLALILSLMEETHIRIGNQYYAEKNKTYGLSTLRTRHVDLYHDKMKFSFVGKKGKKHDITLRNRRLQKLVLQCEEIPGWELFQYYDKTGAHQSVDSGMVNDYIQELSGKIFSAKDFRTWSGSKIFLSTLMKLEEPTTLKARKQNIIKAYDTVANALGNTRSVCKKYYIHPIISDWYEKDRLTNFLSNLPTQSTKSAFFSETETALMALLSEYDVVLP